MKRNLAGLKNPCRAMILLPLLAVTTIALPFERPIRCCAQSIQERTDEQVVEALGSRNWVEADCATLEIMKRGQRMIFPLMHLKGDTRTFSGNRLGQEKPYDPFPKIRQETEPISERRQTDGSVTVEVAALFLISAFYYDDELTFAPYPHLLYTEEAKAWRQKWAKVDTTSPYHLYVTAAEYESYKKGVAPARQPEINSPEQIRRAWSSTETWTKALHNEIANGYGVSALIYKKHSPLRDAGVEFIYTSVLMFPSKTSLPN